MRDLYAGVDVGGTRTKFAVAGDGGEVIARDDMATDAHQGPTRVLDRIAKRLATMLSGQACERYSGIGMGMPGWVDLQHGITRFLPNFATQWRDIAVAEPMAAKFGCPVRLMNDVRTATWGELAFGHGKDRRSPTMLFLSLGTGVGGGVVIDGKLRLGPLGAAGEMGHQTIVAGGVQCGCGNHGCLETVASGPAIASEGIRLMQIGLAPHLHKLVGGDIDRVTTERMSVAADDDPAIAAAIERTGELIGIALANIVTTLHPDLVVLGGGVAMLGDRLLEPVRQSIREHVRMFPIDDVQILPSKLTDSAGVLGAIALAIKPPF